MSTLFLNFFQPAERSGDAPKRPLVGQLRSVKLDLNLNPSNPDVTRDPEGNAVLDPGLSGPALGQLPLKVLALVVSLVSGQQVFSSDQLRRGAQLSTVLGGQLDPDLGEPAPLGPCTVGPAEAAQLVKAQLDGLRAVLGQEAQCVPIGGTVGAVVGHHFGHRHRGQPLSLSSPIVYAHKPDLSMTFLYLFCYNFINKFSAGRNTFDIFHALAC